MYRGFEFVWLSLDSAAYGPQPKIADSQLETWESASPISCRFPEALQVPSAAPGAAPGAPGRPLRRAPARMRPYLPACGGASGSRGGNPPCRRLARARVPGWKVYPGFPIGLPWVPVFPSVFVRFPHIKRSPLGSRVFSGFHSSCCDPKRCTLGSHRNKSSPWVPCPIEVDGGS